MPLNEDMLGSEMRDQIRQIRSAQRRGGRGAAMKAGAESATKARQPQSKVTSTNNPATMSRSSRRMGSGLLENAPTKEAPAPEPTKSSGVRTSRSGGGDYPFTKSEPTSVKTTPSAAAGMGSLAMNAAKVLGPVGVLAATQQAAGATPSDEASMMEQIKMNPKSFYNTKGPGSVKSAYAGQSNLSKLMGVGKKGK